MPFVHRLFLPFAAVFVLAGSFVDTIAQPANDNFANRITLTGDSIVVPGVSTAHATAERGEPNPQQTSFQPSVWYSWTPPGDGVVSIFFTGDDFRRSIGVFRGTSLKSLKSLAPLGNAVEFDCQSGETLRIQVLAPVTTPAIDVHLEFTPRPLNDNFANRFALEGVLVSTNGSTRAATREAREPRHNEASIGRSVWYSWRSPAAGWVRYSVAGLLSPLVTQVYAGDSVEALQPAPPLLINESPSEGLFFAEAGVEYEVAIDGEREQGGDVANGSFTFTLDFSGLTLITPTNGAVFVGPATVEAAVGDLLPELDGNAAEITIFVTDLITGESNVLGIIGGPAGSAFWTNPPTGYFVLQARGTNTQDRSLLSNPAGIAIRPANDAFADRSILEGSNVAWTVDFAGATRESKDPQVPKPLHAGFKGATIWWTWTAPADGMVTLGWDDGTVAAAVYTGEELGHFRAVMPPRKNALAREFEVVGGQSYQVFFSAPRPGKDEPLAAPPSFPARLDFIPRPINDDFDNRIVLEGALVATNGTTLAATREKFEPRHNKSALGRSVWYSWRAPAPGWLRVEVDGLPASLLSVIYVGDALDKLQVLAPVMIDGFESDRVFRVEPGVDYKIAIDGEVEEKDVVSSASFGLTLDFSGLTLLSPPNGSVFAESRTIPMTVSDVAPELDGILDVITFFAEELIADGGVIELGTITNSTGGFDWTNASPGRFALYARGVNGVGRIITSNPVGVLIRPANDDFADRGLLVGTNAAWTADFAGATGEPKDPRKGLTLWWTWTAPADGLTALTCIEESIKIAVYSGDEPGRLRTVSPPKSFTNEFAVTGGQSYQILLSIPRPKEADLGATPPVSDVVSLEFTPVPLNDDFANRTVLEGALINTNGSTRAATREIDEPQHNGLSFGQSVWYSWTAPAAGWTRFAVADASGMALRFVSPIYTGNSLETLQPVAPVLVNGSPFPGMFRTEQGVEYLIAIDGKLDRKRLVDNGRYSFKIDFSTLTLLSPTNGTSLAAFGEVALAVSAPSTNLDGILGPIAFISRDPITSGETQIGSIDDSSQTFLWTNLPPGDFVLYARSVNDQGRTILSNPVGVGIRPLNDGFANRAALEGTNAAWTVNFAGATRDPNDPLVAKPLRDRFNGPTLWWAWTAPADGIASLTCNQLTIAFAVYSGEELVSLEMVLSPKAGKGQFNAVGGMTYQILFSDRSTVAPSPPGNTVLKLVPSNP